MLELQETETLPEKKGLEKIVGIILEAVRFGGDYEIQQISSERLEVRILPKNVHYSNAAEEKLREAGYDVTKSEKPNDKNISTLYFSCQFPADEIERVKSEKSIEINDMRDDKEK